jgi:hypothetical protein
MPACAALRGFDQLHKGDVNLGDGAQINLNIPATRRGFLDGLKRFVDRRASPAGAILFLAPTCWRFSAPPDLDRD